MQVLNSYMNGNYRVFIYGDGTKIRANRLSSFEPLFPESIDMKISNRCDRDCPMCHEESVPDGALANLHHPILDTLHTHTELALGGGNVLEHPDLDDFLERMWEKKVICNITIHLDHFLRHVDYLKAYSDQQLIHGLGISVNRPLTQDEIRMIQQFPNAIVHVIAGLVSYETLKSMFDQNIKLLILGYKAYGRGKTFLKEHGFVSGRISWLKLFINQIFNHFSVVSFDNLALEQLWIKLLIPEDRWKTSYMGSDGQFTMYIDLVKEEYAVSSTSERKPLTQDRIEDVFAEVRKSTVCKEKLG